MPATQAKACPQVWQRHWVALARKSAPAQLGHLYLLATMSITPASGVRIEIGEGGDPAAGLGVPVELVLKIRLGHPVMMVVAPDADVADVVTALEIDNLAVDFERDPAISVIPAAFRQRDDEAQLLRLQIVPVAGEKAAAARIVDDLRVNVGSGRRNLERRPMPR